MLENPNKCREYLMQNGNTTFEQTMELHKQSENIQKEQPKINKRSKIINSNKIKIKNGKDR